MWDFSKVQYTGTGISGKMNSSAATEPTAVGVYNMVMNENGYDYFINLSRTSYEEKGYVTKDIAVTYSNSVLKMKYPFSYGDNFTDDFSGVSYYQVNTVVNFSGTYSVSADAYGTLILPDRYIKNALRVKCEKKAIEVHPCNAVDVDIVRYIWYAPGYRYPVFSLVVKTVTRTGQEPVITQNGYISLQQGLWNDATTAIGGQAAVDNSDFTVLSYPNPFSDILSYSYFLRKDMPVKIELYDVTGKFNVNLADDQSQSDGVHTGTFDATTANLTPGVYYIRFTFDKKVVVNKIVKI
jgi:hypothetical protein